jgi:hypothetical protein
MTIRTKSGDVFHQDVNYPLMTQADLEQKFHELVRLRVDEARTVELDRKLKSVEAMANVAALVADLEIV